MSRRIAISRCSSLSGYLLPRAYPGCFRNSPARRFSGGSDALFDVSGLNVVITGGAQGIGLAIAKGFAARGSRIFLLDLGKDRVDESAQHVAAEANCLGAEGFHCDVRDLSTLETAAQSIQASLEARNQTVNVLINCAGVTKRMPAEDFSLEDFDRIMTTNFRGSWCAAMEFGKLMLKDKCGGSIINIDSVVTHTQLKHTLPYAMTKAGVQALTKGLALEWGPQGIRVNGIAPGLIWTPISDALWSQPHMQKWAHQMTPLGRMGQAEDLIGTALFLASPASQFIQGQTLRVDGGMTAGSHWPIEGPDN